MNFSNLYHTSTATPTSTTSAPSTEQQPHQVGFAPSPTFTNDQNTMFHHHSEYTFGGDNKEHHVNNSANTTLPTPPMQYDYQLQAHSFVEEDKASKSSRMKMANRNLSTINTSNLNRMQRSAATSPYPTSPYEMLSPSGASYTPSISSSFGTSPPTATGTAGPMPDSYFQHLLTERGFSSHSAPAAASGFFPQRASPQLVHPSIQPSIDDCMSPYVMQNGNYLPSPVHSPIQQFDTNPNTGLAPMTNGAQALGPKPPGPKPLTQIVVNQQGHQLEFFLCPHPGCGKSFLKMYNLNSHARVHSTEKPHKCKSCPLAFKRKHDLVRHGRLVHKQCHLCSQCFQSAPELTTHLVDVHRYPYLNNASGSPKKKKLSK